MTKTKKPKRFSFSLLIISLLCRRNNYRLWCHKVTTHPRYDPYFYLTDHRLSHLAMTLQNQSKILLWVKNANVPPLGPTSFGTSPALKKAISNFTIFNCYLCRIQSYKLELIYFIVSFFFLHLYTIKWTIQNITNIDVKFIQMSIYAD